MGALDGCWGEGLDLCKANGELCIACIITWSSQEQNLDAHTHGRKAILPLA